MVSDKCLKIAITQALFTSVSRRSEIKLHKLLFFSGSIKHENLTPRMAQDNSAWSPCEFSNSSSPFFSVIYLVLSSPALGFLIYEIKKFHTSLKFCKTWFVSIYDFALVWKMYIS